MHDFSATEVFWHSGALQIGFIIIIIILTENDIISGTSSWVSAGFQRLGTVTSLFEILDQPLDNCKRLFNHNDIDQSATFAADFTTHSSLMVGLQLTCVGCCHNIFLLRCLLVDSISWCGCSLHGRAKQHLVACTLHDTAADVINCQQQYSRPSVLQRHRIQYSPSTRTCSPLYTFTRYIQCRWLAIILIGRLCMWQEAVRNETE